MTRIRGIIVVLSVALLLGGGLYGQDKTDPKLKGTLPANWGKLGLTDVQKQKVYKIQADFKTKLADLEKQVKDLKEKEKADMLGVLTEEQKKRLREIVVGKTGEKTEKDK
jgi:hypothetical protein